jgi:hypothetical protein
MLLLHWPCTTTWTETQAEEFETLDDARLESATESDENENTDDE